MDSIKLLQILSLKIIIKKLQQYLLYKLARQNQIDLFTYMSHIKTKTLAKKTFWTAKANCDFKL